MADDQRILCRICGEPLSLTSDIVTDEDGKAVHEDCYVKRMTAPTVGQNDRPNPLGSMKPLSRDCSSLSHFLPFECLLSLRRSME
jgi:hypothetical protein